MTKHKILFVKGDRNLLSGPKAPNTTYQQPK